MKYEWNSKCQEAFEKLKKALCEAPTLAKPRPEGRFILDTDASDVGIGATLSQLQDGRERVLAYASKKLDRQQQRYSVTCRELLAVVTFVDQFRHYLLGREFTVRTDHSSLRWLHNFKDLRGQLARWLETLSSYNLVLEHREGKKHQNADSMSRRDYDKSMCPYYEGVEPDSLQCGGCELCKSLFNEWKDFQKGIDNVTDLDFGRENKGFLDAVNSTGLEISCQVQDSNT